MLTIYCATTELLGLGRRATQRPTRSATACRLIQRPLVATPVYVLVQRHIVATGADRPFVQLLVEDLGCPERCPTERDEHAIRRTRTRGFGQQGIQDRGRPMAMFWEYVS